MHSSEIAAHQFPKARGGLDPAAVYEWLTMVAASFADLEDELTDARIEREQTSASIRRMRRRPASAEIRGALMQAQLRRRLRGYDRHAVQELLRAAASELGRLENEVGLLNAELELEPQQLDRPDLLETTIRVVRWGSSEPAADQPGPQEPAADQPWLQEIVL